VSVIFVIIALIVGFMLFILRVCCLPWAWFLVGSTLLYGICGLFWIVFYVALVLDLWLE